MANCCSGETCQELLTIGYLKELANGSSGCSINVTGGTDFSSCCNASGDSMTITSGNLYSHVPIWVEDGDSKNNQDGFVIVNQNIGNSATCLTKNDIKLKYTVLTSFSSNSAITIDTCSGGDAYLNTTRKYNIYTVNCNGITSTSSENSDSINIGEFGSYYDNVSTDFSFDTNFENDGESNNETNFSDFTSNGTTTVKLTPCSSTSVDWSVTQEAPRISLKLSVSTGTNTLSCVGGEINIDFSGDCNELLTITTSNTISVSNGKIIIGQNGEGSARDIVISGTVSTAKGDNIGTISISGLTQEACASTLDVLGKGVCGPYWSAFVLKEENVISGKTTCGTVNA